MLDEGVSGFFMLGTSGEGAMLTPETASQVVQATAAFSAGQVPVLAGVLEPSPARAIAAARLAAKSGADAVVVTAPYYYQHEDAARIHLQQVIDAVDIPVILYNIPQITRNKIRIEDVQALADRIIAIKDSSGDMEHVEQLVKIPGLAVFQGAEAYHAASLAIGAAGLVPGMSNVAPGLLVKLYRAASSGDQQKAAELQATLNDLRSYNQAGFWLASLKTAVSMLGYAQPYTAAAVPPIDEAGRAHIRAVLERHGLL
jgi:dihydrodipicolinate synthase/N-acetylneuraminate lyase